MSKKIPPAPRVWARTCCALVLALAACSDSSESGARATEADGDSSREADEDTSGSGDEQSPDDETRDASTGDASSSRRDGGQVDAGPSDSDDDDDDDDDDDMATANRDGGAAMSDGGSGAASDAGSTPPAEGESVSGIPEAELAELRQVCLDEINMYRATLSLAPLAAASPMQSLCSDQGAQKDGESKQAHGSAGAKNPCGRSVAFKSQNTCPDWPVGRFGAATIADSLKRCLAQMWAEGEPPGGEEKCVQDYFAGNTACFLAHGHYLNMKGSSKGVACGFYKTGANTYWMNQDFF